jgi:DNA-binding response OmpR family regulator
MPSASQVLFSSVSPGSAGLRSALADAGFEVIEHVLGSPQTTDLDGVAVAVIEVGDSEAAAITQTRRWRLERGDDRVPVLWVLASGAGHTTAAGLEAGADACLANPVDPAVLAAQVRALTRARAASSRLAARAAEARLLGDQLRKAYRRMDAEAALAGQVHRVRLDRPIPRIGAARFEVCHRSRSRNSRDFFGIRRLDQSLVGFFLGNVVGQGSAASSLLALFVHEAIDLKESVDSGPREPHAILTALNQQLLALGLEDPPLLAMLVGVLDCRQGSVSLARAGLPAPIHVPNLGAPMPWGVPGPFLGTSEATFEKLSGTLLAGDRLVFGSDGTRGGEGRSPDREADLPAAMARYRNLMGRAFPEALSGERLSQSNCGEDFTLMVVEMTEQSTEATIAVPDPAAS